MATVNICITVRIGFVFEPVGFAGELCRGCKDPIYGAGFNMVVTTNVNRDDLPRFHESKINYCTSCKEAYDNSNSRT